MTDKEGLTEERRKEEEREQGRQENFAGILSLSAVLMRFQFHACDYSLRYIGLFKRFLKVR